MVSWIRILVPALLVVAALSGCLGADSDVDTSNGELPPANGNGNGNETANGNQTTEPPRVVHDPVPQWNVSIAADGGEAVEAPFYFPRNIDLDITLDGSASTVENSTIDVYAWMVTTPNGREHAQAGGDATFTFNATNIQTEHFGVYTVTLRVLSADGGISSTTGHFVLSMTHSTAFENTLLGVGLPDCGGDPVLQSPASDYTNQGAFYVGTYLLRTLSVAPNVTKLDLSLTYDAGPQTQLRLYVFAPGADASDCSAAMANSPAGASPVTLTIEDLPEQSILGTYTIRVQMEGITIDGFTLDMVATYAAPGGDADADEEAEDEGEE